LASGFMTPPEGLLAPAPHECICTTCPPHRDAINVVDCTRLITRLVGRSCFSAVVRRGADILLAAMRILTPIAPQYRAMALTCLSLCVRADSTGIWRPGTANVLPATQRRGPDATQSSALPSVQEV